MAATPAALVGTEPGLLGPAQRLALSAAREGGATLHAAVGSAGHGLGGLAVLHTAGKLGPVEGLASPEGGGAVSATLEKRDAEFQAAARLARWDRALQIARRPLPAGATLGERTLWAARRLQAARLAKRSKVLDIRTLRSTRERGTCEHT